MGFVWRPPPRRHARFDCLPEGRCAQYVTLQTSILSYSLLHSPTTGFTGPFWRNVLIFAGVFTGLAVFSPSDMLRGASNDSDETPWLTRVIAHNAPSKETWQKVNERHLQQTEELARNAHLVQHAKQPTVHRFRYARCVTRILPPCHFPNMLVVYLLAVLIRCLPIDCPLEVQQT